jgi:DNA-binding beta-propeller fold protein YncE
VAVDPAGKFVFTVELKNHRVQKFFSNGSFITKWEYNGTGGRDVNRAPHQIAVNSIGNLYLSDPKSNQLLKYQDNGTFLGTIGSKGTTPGKFSTPHGISFDSNDNIYVTDMKNYRIQVFDSNDSFIREWRSTGTGADNFSEPSIATIILESLRSLYI